MSASWMSGYVGDVSYTLGFYRELAPTYLQAACVFNGVQGPDPTQPLRYCELGCGRGYGTVLLAAANPNIDFVGIDFNPSHIAEARDLASRAGIRNITFFELAFGEAAQSDHPLIQQFNIVGIHGVYSWVLPAVRDDIHRFLREKLVAGGLVYNSYNALPGWAIAAPIQYLVLEAAGRSRRGSVAVVTEAFDLLKKLADGDAAFVKQNPGVKARLQRMAKQDRVYLAHEFVNAGWQPLYVTQTMANFSESKLTYIGSASLLENSLEFAIPKNLRAIVEAASDVGMRELLKDYIVNKQFRRDLYLKGPQNLTAREQRNFFQKLAFARTQMTADLPEKFQAPIGEISIKRDVVSGLLNLMTGKVTSGADLLVGCEKIGLRYGETVAVLQLLINSGLVSPARPDSSEIDRVGSHRLNDLVFDISLSRDAHRFLASPVLGSAIAASFVDRVVAPIVKDNPTASDTEVAIQAFDRLAPMGQSFQLNSRALRKTDESVREVARQVKDFRANRLRLWEAIGIEPNATKVSNI